MADTPESSSGSGVNMHLSGLSQQAASQTDAYLLVQGQKLRVHSAVLILISPVFSDFFSTARSQNLAAERSRDYELCVKMSAEHTVADLNAALAFIYQRSNLGCLSSAPSKQLWLSVDTARPIIKFVHKFNMTSILEEADHCLCKKARDEGFNSLESAIAWCSLAEDCSLKKLLSETELFLLNFNDTTLWQAVHQLSQASQDRLFRAAHHDNVQHRRKFRYELGDFINSSTLLSWQD